MAAHTSPLQVDDVIIIIIIIVIFNIIVIAVIIGIIINNTTTITKLENSGRLTAGIPDFFQVKFESFGENSEILAKSEILHQRLKIYALIFRFLRVKQNFFQLCTILIRWVGTSEVGCAYKWDPSGGLGLGQAAA